MNLLNKRDAEKIGKQPAEHCRKAGVRPVRQCVRFRRGHTSVRKTPPCGFERFDRLYFLIRHPRNVAVRFYGINIERWRARFRRTDREAAQKKQQYDYPFYLCVHYEASPFKIP